MMCLFGFFGKAEEGASCLRRDGEDAFTPLPPAFQNHAIVAPHFRRLIVTDDKSFLERRETAEVFAAQIKEMAPNIQSVSFIERQEIHHHHHHSAPRAHFVEELANDIGKGLEQTFTIR
jgi:hypothetical protein